MSSSDPETWMWERARARLEHADRVQRTPCRPRPPGSPRPSWEPSVDVFEGTSELWVQVALPGVELEQIDIAVERKGLIVSGQRALPRAFRRSAVHRLEIPHGRFERHVELPSGRYELTQSKLVDGCLFLSFKKLDG